MIKETDKRILEALSHAVRGSLVRWEQPPEEALFAAAAKHNVLPLVADALGGLEALPEQYVRRTQQAIVRQAARTAELCLLLSYLRDENLHPLVIKGLVCRTLYPEPEHRPSTDEDLLVDPAEFPQIHQALLAYGFRLVQPDKDLRASFEVSYEDPERGLCVEVHKALFSQNMPYLNRMNGCFRGMFDRAVTERVCGVPIRTLGENDHLLFLILHALKHFLYSGVGIRQVCDVILYSERHREAINWAKLKRNLTELHAIDFARALYRIAGDYLLPENHMSEYLTEWDAAGIDAEPLLEDIMEGGVYGTSTRTRAHSATMTLNAAATQRSDGTKALLHSVFQPRKNLQSRYRYLKKAPYLLPLAWVQRLLGYCVELLRGDRRTNSALDSIRLGSERIRLLEQYHIICSNNREN